MPVPTDTFWNLKRLNVVFAASAILLMAVTGWTIVQDYGAWWRVPQKDSRVWEAALVSDKIDRLNSPELETEIAAVQTKIDAALKDLSSRQNEINQLNARIRQLDSERATIEFTLNADKAPIAVDEAHLQDAITEKNQSEIDSLTRRLQGPEGRSKLTRETEALEAKKNDLEEQRTKLKVLTRAMDAANKERNRLLADQEGLKKRLDQLAPKSVFAQVSSKIRAMPLMGFLNPSERPLQIVLPDVLTDMNFNMKVTTLDRCMTCHVNIAKKDFTEEKVLAYLEEQTATAKGLKLPEKWSGVATDPLATNASPGTVAMTEFWHAWAKALAPESFKKSVGKLKTITNTVGKAAKVIVDGKSLTAFAYDPAPAPSTQPTTQPVLNAAANDKVLLTLLEAVLKYDGSTSKAQSADGSVVVELSGLTTAQLKPVRNASMRYADELRTALKSSLNASDAKLLFSRYRYAMTDAVNRERKARGMQLLPDPSPVLLAHPRLDLYVDVDSKHSFEAVGCTSCHDGSGQETDFVVTAHVPRNIWVDEKTGEPVLANQLKQPVTEEKEFNLSSMLASAVEHPDSLKIAPTTQQSDALKQLTHAGHEEKEGPIGYVDPVSGAQGKAVTQFKHWQEKYEPLAPRGFHLVYEEWDWPMRTPEYIQVNCARCHSEVYDIKDTAPVLFEGRYLFANLGCSNCHQMDSIPTEQNRKVGTDLRHVTAKLSPAYINTWIWAPKAFRPSTKMPHFFMLENNSSPEELRRTRLEARAITEYLVRTATPLPPAHPIPEGLKGSAEAGQKVFDSIGCMGCHVNLNDPTGTKRPDGKLLTRGEQWIVADLTKKGTTPADARMQYDAMSYNQRQVYAMENFEVLPGATEVARYADGTPKPQFVHHGPELSGIGTKLTAGRTEDQARAWLFDWLKEPRHYSDYTIMPRLRLSDQQAMDLAEFLLSMKRSNGIQNDPWKADLVPDDPEKLIELMALQLKSKYTLKTAFSRADNNDELTPLAVAAMTSPAVPVAEAKERVAKMSKDEKRLVILGLKMIANYGCMSCHAINGAETISSPCANLSDWGQKQVSKLDYGYLSEHAISELPPTSQVKIVNGLCSDAVKLAHEEKPTSETVDVAWPVVRHLRQDWITQKLKNTRVFDRGQALKEPDPTSDDSNLKVGRPYDKLKMPTFYLTDEQVHAIVTFVLSNRDRLVSEKLWKRTTNEQAIRISRGRELVQRYNCVSCHIVETNKPQVQQYFKSDDIMVLAPPSLRGEGNKIQHAWLFNFFKNVIQMRPRIFTTIRMPSFPATDEEWTSIIAYFNQISSKESRDLRKDLDPVVKYINEQRAAEGQELESPGVSAAGAASQPATRVAITRDPSKPGPGDDWITRPEFAGAVQKLHDWAITYNQMIESQLDPKQKPDDLIRNYRTALSRALFVMELYDAPYPFVESNTPEVSDERFHRGERFFYQLQCLSCHVLGDPTIDGANKNPTAPNLSLAHLRLQRRWVRHWVQEPDVIQKGTAMPPFFTGLPIFATVTPDAKAPLGQSQPRAQNVAEPQASEIEEKYGKTVEEQTGLLLDFLYAAGARGYTGKQPAATSAAKPASLPTTRPN